jgi:hypothetical protein
MTADLLDFASEFRFKLYPDGHHYVDVAELAVTVQWRGDNRWAVCDSGWCYDADGNRTYESSPSERTDEFKVRFRFSRDEAVHIAREVVVPALRALWDERTARAIATRGDG